MVFLLLGAVLLLPYVMIVGLLAQMLTGPGQDNRAGVLATMAAAAVLAVAPPLLAGTRELEIVAARALLGADLPVPARGPLALETRLRSALWFGLHLISGGLIGVVALILVPVALLALTERLGLTRGALEGLDLGPLGATDLWAWAVTGVGLLVGSVAGAAGLGALAATMAPVLLGPSPAERAAALRARERRLAERNRLARELHDSIGHALTAVTVQAGAARTVFATDPEFARRAIEAIEETGRAALAELDAVLGVLRDEAAERHSAPTLADLDRLLTPDVTADVAAVDVPPQVSREAYRIVQESLTNAARHGRGPARLTVRQDGDLVIEVVNAHVPAPRRPGHGLDGMRERVELLGGTLTAGPDGDSWRVQARLPVRPS